jgi:glyoxylase-like metal-dependent hydrolase (beta-lactamase superfamily II)
LQRWNFTKGLHEIGTGAWAYLQPNGGWGLANSGLIVDGDQTLLVDTLVDGHHTLAMLKTIQDAIGLKAADIRTVVNTHGDPDHTFGNYLLQHAEIIASDLTAKELASKSPQRFTELMHRAPAMGEVGEFLLECFSAFDWAGCELRLPTKTFEGEMHLKVGDKDVHLIQVGPAHTQGDTLVHVPQDRVVYTGDILFIEGTPVIWAGPVRRWIDACNRILAMDVDVVVPGHGPITDKSGAIAVRDYLTYVDHETRRRYDAGMSVDDAMMDIPLGPFANLIDAERLAVNVQRLYDEYSGSPQGEMIRFYENLARMNKRLKERRTQRTA